MKEVLALGSVVFTSRYLSIKKKHSIYFDIQVGLFLFLGKTKAIKHAGRRENRKLIILKLAG